MLTHVCFQSLKALLLHENERDAASAILKAFPEIVEGQHYSSAYESIGCDAVDMQLQGDVWLGVDHEFCKAISKYAPEHPFVQEIRSNPRSVTLVRSRLMADGEWHKTAMYQAVDAPLNVQDMIGLYFPTPAGHLYGVFCGRSESFSEADVRRADDFRFVVNALLQNVINASSSAKVEEKEIKLLSIRESEVMDWITEGKSNHEIALILGISQHTVRKHLENIFDKLKVNNRTSAALEWKRN